MLRRRQDKLHSPLHFDDFFKGYFLLLGLIPNRKTLSGYIAPIYLTLRPYAPETGCAQRLQTAKEAATADIKAQQKKTRIPNVPILELFRIC